MSKSTIDNVRTDLPTLERALQLQNAAASAGLDWPEAAEVWSKVNEELAEAKAASEDISILGARIAARRAEGIEPKDTSDPSVRELLRDELGDLLFAVVDICRMLGVNPDESLKEANSRFCDCFRHVEEKMRSEGRLLGLENPASINLLWKESKKIQRLHAASILWKGTGSRSQEELNPLLGNYARA